MQLTLCRFEKTAMNTIFDDSQENVPIDLQYYFYLFRSQWMLLVTAALLGAAIAFFAATKGVCPKMQLQ